MCVGAGLVVESFKSFSRQRDSEFFLEVGIAISSLSSIDILLFVCSEFFACDY